MQKYEILETFNRQVSKEEDHTHVHIIHVWMSSKPNPTGFTTKITKCPIRFILRENVAQHM